jgi:hypothetical protein
MGRGGDLGAPQPAEGRSLSSRRGFGLRTSTLVGMPGAAQYSRATADDPD